SPPERKIAVRHASVRVGSPHRWRLAMRARSTLVGLAIFAAGYAGGGGGGGGSTNAATTLFELNGGSLAEQLQEAGPPLITPGFRIAQRVPADGTRPFALALAR